VFEGSSALQEILIKLLDFAEGDGSASEILQDIKSFAEDAFIDGRVEGRSEGYYEGHSDGQAEGYREGHSDGYDEGWESGYWQAQEETPEDCTC